jgi:acyl carrier protein
MQPNATDRIKRLIVERLELPVPAGFDDATPLFDGGLGMDSFAAVELITLIEAEFDIEFNVADITPEHFKDLRGLAGLVERYRPGP